MQPRVIVSACLCLVACALVLWGSSTTGNELAVTIVGVLLGYWFNHAERQVAALKASGNGTGVGEKPPAPPAT